MSFYIAWRGDNLFSYSVVIVPLCTYYYTLMAVKVKLHLYYSGVMVCNIGDILLGRVVGVMYGWFHLPRLDLLRLYPFDSLRSLRVTVVGKVFSKKVPKEDSHHSGVMYGLFHLPRLDLRKLYPFDSLRSLRVTVVGRVLVSII